MKRLNYLYAAFFLALITVGLSGCEWINFNTRIKHTWTASEKTDNITNQITFLNDGTGYWSVVENDEKESFNYTAEAMESHKGVIIISQTFVNDPASYISYFEGEDDVEQVEDEEETTPEQPLVSVTKKDYYDVTVYSKRLVMTHYQEELYLGEKLIMKNTHTRSTSSYAR